MRNFATGIGALEPRSSSVSLEVEQQAVVIEEANPPSEMRRVVVPSVHQEELTEQPTAQPTILPLVPMNQERTMVERVEPTLERFEPETAPLTTLMPYLGLAIASQDMLATLTTAKTLLLLTFGPQFENIFLKAVYF